MSELARREFGRVNLLQLDKTIIHVLSDVRADSGSPRNVRLKNFIEDENGCGFIPRRRRCRELCADG